MGGATRSDGRGALAPCPTGAGLALPLPLPPCVCGSRALCTSVVIRLCGLFRPRWGRALILRALRAPFSYVHRLHHWRCYALPVRPLGALLPPLGVGRSRRGVQAPLWSSPIPASPRALWLRVLSFPAPLGQSGSGGGCRHPFFSATALLMRVGVGAVSPLAFLAGFASPAPAPSARHLMTFFVGYRHVLRA